MFHNTGLSYGQAGGIAYVVETKDAQGVDRTKFVSFVAGWVRTRRGDTDKVFYTTPEQLSGPPSELVKTDILQGKDFKRRFNLKARPCATVDGLLRGAYPGGYYSSVLMARVGQYAAFTTTTYKLNPDSWEPLYDTVQSVTHMEDWLHEDFFGYADSMPTAWPVLFAAAELFGGQSFKNVEVPAGLPQDLSEACYAEQKFRESRRRVSRMSPEQIETFRNSLAGTPHLDSFEALLKGERTHV